ncbi:dihydrofolate reductase [Brachybacterium sacelli]|uniref:Dihydrofolate reductase n=2 Tax=Brachybacterium sacelli TaxID=173364 RepID=A0ABS4WVY5_9MICO|nr:dihydrofolate reductase [Brachybacterium sacelli]MBP2380368.1 dihydrofolate reductase [Brachybacterium sacelli]
MIWAQARDGVIGASGAMPWHLPEDLKHFSRTTKGSPVVMGRRTWESFPPKYRPLPGRTNIVITRDDAFADEGAVRARTIEEALDLAGSDLAARAGSADRAELGDQAEPASTSTIWVIGGGRVYREAMDRADLLVVTEIDLEIDGDTTAPPIPADFPAASTDPDPSTADSPWHTSRTGLRYRILTYSR